ncbi:MAG: hypothetical protein ACKOXK_08575 [Chakrabartia sp.]
MKLFVFAFLVILSLTAYQRAYPYRSVRECINEEIKAGGTSESAKNFCWEERNNGNLRSYGIDPFRNDFVIYAIVRMVMPNSGDHFDLKTAQPIEEATVTEGSANDTITN